MGRNILPGTIQIRVSIDGGESDSFSTDLCNWLSSMGKKVIECTPDYSDKFDPARKKFFVTALPKTVCNPGEKA